MVWRTNFWRLKFQTKRFSPGICDFFWSPRVTLKKRKWTTKRFQTALKPAKNDVLGGLLEPHPLLLVRHTFFDRFMSPFSWQNCVWKWDQIPSANGPARDPFRRELFPGGKSTRCVYTNGITIGWGKPIVARMQSCGVPHLTSQLPHS